jgi:hypothetical protein
MPLYTHHGTRFVPGVSDLRVPWQCYDVVLAASKGKAGRKHHVCMEAETGMHCSNLIREPLKNNYGILLQLALPCLPDPIIIPDPFFNLLTQNGMYPKITQDRLRSVNVTHGQLAGVYLSIHFIGVYRTS